MFVRWNRRERARTGKFLLAALLIQAERRDGKPRQKVVAYLGSIKEERVPSPYIRKWFWRDVDRRLDSLGLEAEVRQKVEASLVVRVPRPTEEEIDAADQAREERFRQIKERPHRR